ncbi:glycosyltransferase [Flavobacteriaceae bacterium M23B6Z8]
MKLLVISHTEHYKTTEGTIVGHGTTVTELNHLLEIFEEIYHIGVLKAGAVPGNALPYASERVTFIALKPYGGKTLMDKLSILFQAPDTLQKVGKYLAKTDVFQFRTPTGMGVYMIPYLSYLSHKKGWFKYAGNWKQDPAPLGYRIQRWLLKKQHLPVTINGKWPDAPSHCLAFENPCLSEENREIGAKIIKSKGTERIFKICFVGRLEDAKGVDKLIDALILLDEERRKAFSVMLVGKGNQEELYKRQVREHALPVSFLGLLPQPQVFEKYAESDFLVLPSKSEGFPKVIGEAMNFGCIPIASDVSSIGQYIKDGENGFLIKPNTVQALELIFKRILETEATVLDRMRKDNYSLAEKFTYKNYVHRIKNEVIEKHLNLDT